ncbi:MAG TPA: MFS transporter, partial [Alphaproteobacteria bacterium]
AAPPPHGTRWSGVGFGIALGALAAYAHFKLPPALPAMLAEFGYGRLLAGALMSVFAVAGLALSAPIGRALSRLGIGRFLAAALALLAAGGGAGLIWPEGGAVMLAARALEGVAYAILGVAGAVIVAESASPRQRPIALSLYAGWMPYGQVAAVLVAAASAGLDPWRGLWLAGIAAAAGLGLWGAWLSRRGLLPQPAAPVGARHGAPARASPARRRAILAGALLYTLWTTQWMAFMTWLPQFLVEAHGLDLRAAVLGYAVPPAVVIGFNLVGGAALRRGTPLGLLLLPGLALQAAVWLSMAVVGSGLAGVLALAAYGLGTGLTAVCLFALPGALAGPGLDIARGFGVLMTGRNIGVLIGPMLLAEVLERAGDWAAVGPLFAAVALAALALAAWLARVLSRLAAPAVSG